MRIVILFLLVIVFGSELEGQTGSDIVRGKVSFVSPQNIYVKFSSTSGIMSGDTLFKSVNGTIMPVLKVNNLSTTSCVCSSVSDLAILVTDELFARKKVTALKPAEEVIEKVIKEPVVKKDSVAAIKKESNPDALKQKIRGSISAYSYSDFSNTTARNSTIFRYTFSLDARNLGDSKFSFENYVSFRHKLGDWGVVKNNVFNALKIYSLAVKYDLNKTTQISLGRKINQKISNIGAMDGLQVEKSFNKFAIGALAGTRPDYTNYGFNSKLFQYGAYVSYSTKSVDAFSESSLAFMEQMNGGKTDRRFLYLQHSNSLINNLFFLGILEADLYRVKNGKPQSTFNLTGSYLSLRYKMTKNISLTGSYDARKNVLYYETYKTFIDSVMENERRQNFRLQVNYRITKDLVFGLESGYRLSKSDPHPSKNLYGYLTYSRVPGLNISVTLSGTYMVSNYINSKILVASITRDLFQSKLQAGLGYRYVDYKLTESPISVMQNIGEANISWQFTKYMSLSLNYEGTFEQKNRYNRVYFQIRKRF
jgi:hypothetical protein